MSTDIRIQLVKDRFALGKLKRWADVFSIVPFSILAAESGISLHKIKHPQLLLAKELRKITTLLKIASTEVITLMEHELTIEDVLPFEISVDTALKIDILRDRIGLGKVQLFTELFQIIPKTTIAGILHLNNDRMGSLVANPGGISLKLLMRIAQLFEITPTLLFELINNDLSETEGKAIKRIKPTIKIRKVMVE
jgi:hypothetical protein